MKTPAPGRQSGAGEGAEQKKSQGSFSTSAPAPSNEVVFIRREECRKCPAAVWALYYFAPDGDAARWGVHPIDACGQPDRCGEKVCGLDEDGDVHTALARMLPGGAA